MKPSPTLFNRKKVVKHWKTVGGIQKPEEAILNLLRDELPAMSMLDIGVGAGRTTQYFRPLVKRYLGIDYSPGLIDACREKFGTSMHLQFKVWDARNLRALPEDRFDFILFSYNGIDHNSHDDRSTILSNIASCLAPNGYFCFSSHNLHSVTGNLIKPRELRYAKDFLYGIYRYPARMIFKLYCATINKFRYGGVEEILRREYAIINEYNLGGMNGDIYYVKPRHQIRKLQGKGFTDIRLFSLSGGEINDPLAIDGMRDRWVYFLCRAVA